MKIKSTILCIIALVLLNVFLGSTVLANEAEYTMKFAATMPAIPMESMVYDQFVAFKTEVESKTEGRIKVEYYGSGQLGEHDEMITGIMEGSIEIASTDAGPLASFDANIDVISIPYLFPSDEIAWRVLDGKLGEILSEGLEEKGIKVVGGFLPKGFRHFTNSKRPIHSVKDMEGLKFRVMENQLFIKMVEGLGASAHPMDPSKMYLALQTGTVDGQENPFSVIGPYSLFEVQKYLTLDGHSIGCQVAIMNSDYLNNLPAELREIVLVAFRNATVAARGSVAAYNAHSLLDLATKFDETYFPSDEELAEFQTKAQGPVVEWLKTKIGSEIIDLAFSEVEEAKKELKSGFYLK